MNLKTFEEKWRRIHLDDKFVNIPENLWEDLAKVKLELERKSKQATVQLNQAERHISKCKEVLE